MSFGFSIGDFLAVIKLAKNVRKDFSGAPRQFHEISSEYVILPNPSFLLLKESFEQGEEPRDYT